MATQYGIPYLFSCNGETAEVGPQDLADAAYVGIPSEISGLDSPEVRESFDNVVEGDGGIHGNFYFGRRPFSFEVLIDPAVTSENVQIDRLNKATNALRTDGTLTWTETGRAQTRLLYRRTGFRISDKRPKRVLVALVASNPRIEAATATTSGTGTVTNAGNMPAPAVFTLTAPTNTITITKSSPSPSETLTLTGLSGAGTVTVDFGAHTVTATSGAANRYSAVVFPGSAWWELQPGANTVSVSGATVSGSGISFRSAWL